MPDEIIETGGIRAIPPDIDINTCRRTRAILRQVVTFNRAQIEFIFFIQQSFINTFQTCARNAPYPCLMPTDLKAPVRPDGSCSSAMTAPCAIRPWPCSPPCARPSLSVYSLMTIPRWKRAMARVYRCCAMSTTGWSWIGRLRNTPCRHCLQCPGHNICRTARRRWQRKQPLLHAHKDQACHRAALLARNHLHIPVV